MIEDSKWVSRSSKSKKEGQCNDQKRQKEQTMTLHRKPKSEQQEPYLKPRVNYSAPQE